MTKIFVVSLPRTGTSSIATLLNNVAIKCKHVPSNYYNHLKDEYDAFADTPCFVPIVILIIYKLIVINRRGEIKRL